MNSQNQASCRFPGGAYHVTAIPSFTHNCDASIAVYDNFIYQVQIQFIQGDCGGLIFRADPVNGTSYYFEICRNPDPNHVTYNLSRYDSRTQPEFILPVQVGNLPTIMQNNHNSAMTLPIIVGVVARGNNFELWIDNQELDVGFDLTAKELKEGEIGVAANGGYVKGEKVLHSYPQSRLTIIAFRNAKVWTFYSG
jgi:hypothetical protein